MYKKGEKVHFSNTGYQEKGVGILEKYNPLWSMYNINLISINNVYYKDYDLDIYDWELNGRVDQTT